MNEVYVTKRTGKKEPVKLEKVLSRIEKQSYKLDPSWIKPFDIAKKVIEGIYDGVTTEALDNLAVETAAALTAQHPDYAVLAGRLAISSLHKTTERSFSKATDKLYNNIDPETGERAPLVSEEYYKTVVENSDELNSAIIKSRDFTFDIFGYKTLEKSYLLKTYNEKKKALEITETPQYVFMRVAIGIHGNDIESALETYDMMTEKYFTHATPTLFNAGTNKPQMSSCFLLQAKDDSIKGIYDTLSECADISQSAGGIGLSIHNIRTKGSYIKGTNGTSNGIVPMLKVFNETARYVDQGGGKRKGSIAIYIEPWHGDIFDLLEMKKNHGKEEMRARDLFYAMWLPDLFMQRVENDQDWALMDPKECPGLDEVYSEKFVELYEKYEAEGKYIRKIKARELWTKMLESQMETGGPYMLYKDACNVKSNQKNLGTIKCSNLCAEIIEFTSPEETAVCNLASICLPNFVKGRKNKKFDFEKLEQVSYRATINLNKVIDINFYPVETASNSNFKHRPIGLGTQGLADVFFLMDMSYGDAKSADLNKKIYETIYYASLKASNDLAKKEGSYSTFKGSPASEGILQFDMWGVTPSDRYDWEGLRADIIKYGLRNSLTTCSMPTASTASIFGNEAAAEAQQSNMYLRRVLSGEFIIVNKHLVRELCDLGIWSNGIKSQIMSNNGSVQAIDEIPENLKHKYRTTWEISQKDIINMYAGRGAYIDQTQSMNIHMAQPNFGSLTAMHFFGWGGGVTVSEGAQEELDLFLEEISKIEGELSGDIVKQKSLLENKAKYGKTPESALKTGMYYLRTKAAADAVKFTVDTKKVEAKVYTEEEAISCSIEAMQNGEDCEACGS